MFLDIGVTLCNWLIRRQLEFVLKEKKIHYT